MRLFPSLCAASLSIAISISTVAHASTAPAHALPSGAQGSIVLAANTGSARGACVKQCKSTYNCKSLSPGERPTCASNLRSCIAGCK